MTLYRFFVSPECLTDATVTFTKDVSKQILNVLRLKPFADQVIVLDNSGLEHTVMLGEIQDGFLTGIIQSSNPGRDGSLTKLRLLFSLTKKDKMEWILQKGTELGVREFQPYYSSRSLVRKDTSLLRKRERWEAIMREAAEQSDQARLPNLLPVLSLKSALEDAQQADLKLIAWEETGLEKVLDIGRVVPSHAALLVGPEGGFPEEEVRLAEQFGFTQVNLGESILRMETACIVGAALVLHETRKLNC